MPALDQKRRLTAFAVAMAVLIATPLAVVATDAFTDVAPSNVHHDDITWLKDAGVTLGCNPPSNDRYCPSDDVTRAQMASFMRRLAENQVVDAGTLEGQSVADIIAASGDGSGIPPGAIGSAGAQVLDFNESILVDTADWVPLLTVEVDVSGESNVTLAAHVYLERAANENQRYRVKIAGGDCTGDPVGVGWWRPDNSDGGFEADTIAVTGFDVISEPAAYVLCAAKFSAAGPDITAHLRGITATWVPSS